MVYLRAMAVWLLIMLTETLHGTARIFLLVPILGDFRARQITVFTGALLIFTVASLLIKWIKPLNTVQCYIIGLLWVSCTVAFEISLGVLAFNMSWQRIAEDYNLLQGGLMPLGLLLMFLTPLAAAKARSVFQTAI